LNWTLSLIHFCRTVASMTISELLAAIEPRMAVGRAAPNPYRALDAFDRSIDLDPRLRELVRIRVSQLNGCAYCLDQHVRDALAAGEGERRLATLAAWRESVFFTARERAGLALAEQVTLIGQGGVSDDVWADAASQFSEVEMAQLLLAIVAINAWNRVAISTHMVPDL
jgi:AhpD family alkylhydroperoxidase